MGELITEKGIGNGISLIIFANIVSRLPIEIQHGYVSASSSTNGIIGMVIFAFIGLATILGIVYIYQGQRRVPVQYPTKRSVGRGMLVGSSQTTYIPMQVNSAGMIPLIFASSLLLFPTVISSYLQTSSIAWLKSTAIWFGVVLNPQSWWYWLAEALLVLAFTYFYAYVMWQQQNIPENLQKQGAFIPGYRPGEPTNRYLTTILNRITLGGAIFLGIVTFAQYFANFGASQLFSAASVLIAVGVVLDTVRQLESQMVMRNYSGFLT
jgi:preprotein translocase subunit SecY